MPEQQQEKSIGGFWRKEGKAGVRYWSGTLELEGQDKVAVVAFVNDRKQPGENTPDIRLYRARPRPEQPAPQEEVPTIQIDQSDIPF